MDGTSREAISATIFPVMGPKDIPIIAWPVAMERLGYMAEFFEP